MHVPRVPQVWQSRLPVSPKSRAWNAKWLFRLFFLASWLLAYLESHPEWKHKAIAEVEQLLSNHSSVPMSSSHETRLSAVPIEAWETDMPVFDAMIRETLRVAQPHTAMRRNIGPETYINGARIPSGAYVVYPFSDVHLNATLYPDPWRWDPARSESKAPFSYVGWGGGM